MLNNKFSPGKNIFFAAKSLFIILLAFCFYLKSAEWRTGGNVWIFSLASIGAPILLAMALSFLPKQSTFSLHKTLFFFGVLITELAAINAGVLASLIFTVILSFWLFCRGKVESAGLVILGCTILPLGYIGVLGHPYEANRLRTVMNDWLSFNQEHRDVYDVWVNSIAHGGWFGGITATDKVPHFPLVDYMATSQYGFFSVAHGSVVTLALFIIFGLGIIFCIHSAKRMIEPIGYWVASSAFTIFIYALIPIAIANGNLPILLLSPVRFEIIALAWLALLLAVVLHNKHSKKCAHATANEANSELITLVVISTLLIVTSQAYTVIKGPYDEIWELEKIYARPSTMKDLLLLERADQASNPR